jgi:hypothetical protein
MNKRKENNKGRLNAARHEITNDNLLVQIHEYHTCYRHSPSLQQQKQLKNAAKVVGYETCERWSAHINLTSEKHTPGTLRKNVISLLDFVC